MTEISKSQLKGFNDIYPNSHKEDYRSPNYLLHYIDSRWGLNYDAACELGINNVVPKTLRLEDKWPNRKWPVTIYSNPPFDTSSIIKWIQKGYQWTQEQKVTTRSELQRRVSGRNRRTHVILMPNKLTNVQLQNECTLGVFPIWNDTIFLGGRINFEGPNVVKGGASRNGCVLLIQRNYGSTLNHQVEFVPLKRLKAIHKGF